MQGAETFEAVVAPERGGERLDVFAAELAGVTRSRAGALIREGRVAADGAAQTKAGFRLKPGMAVAVTVPEAAPATVQAEDIPDRGAYMLPEITVDDRGAVLSGAALYVDHKYRGRLEGQPVRLLCLLLGSEVESACSFHGPDWAVWLKDARTDRSGTTLQLTLEPAFWEGTPDRQEAEAYLSQMGDALLAELKRLRCDLLALPDFFDTEYRVAVTVNTP